MPTETVRFRTGFLTALMFVCAYATAETGKTGFTDDKNRPSLFSNSSNSFPSCFNKVFRSGI